MESDHEDEELTRTPFSPAQLFFATWAGYWVDPAQDVTPANEELHDTLESPAAEAE